MRHLPTLTVGLLTAAALGASAVPPSAAAPAHRHGPEPVPAHRHGPVAAPPGPAAAAAPHGPSCVRGELCLWTGEDHTGERYAYDLSTTDVESCVPLPRGATARSLANRTGRPVTTYQSRECATEGDFETYPGSGTWTPESPYAVRAFQIQEH